MGTRSVTKVYDYDGTVLCAMYRQYDGYYTGHGQELADWLATKKLVNGIRGDEDKTKIANGLGCLAAQMIAHFKEEDSPGHIYLNHPTDDACQEYTYEVRCDGTYMGPEDKKIRLVAQGYYGPAFNGDPADFDGAFLEEHDCEDWKPDYGPLRVQAMKKIEGVLTNEEKEALGL